VARHLGIQLVEDLKWRQGVLLPILSWSTIFLNTDPATDLSRKAMSNSEIAPVHAPQLIVPHWVATGVPSGKPSKQKYIVVSQTCDIAKPVEIEPFVVVMRAFTTTNPRINQSAIRDNTRQFVLNPRTGLVVDAGVQALIEKPLLATLTPEQSGADVHFERRFANWLARRYGRAAHPDSFVDAVVRPIHTLFRELEESGDPDFIAIRQLEEIRVAIPPAEPPFTVRLFLIAPEVNATDQNFRIRISSLVAKIQRVIDGSHASVGGWGLYTFDALPARVYRETDLLSFDEFSYATGSLAGTEPPNMAV
jgi:hypothetical protein